MNYDDFQAEVPVDAEVCTDSGNAVVAQQPEAGENVTTEASKTSMNPPVLVEAQAPAVQITPQTLSVPTPQKKGFKKVLTAIAIVLVIAAVAVFLYLQGADGRVIDEAQSLFYSGNYSEALNLLDTIENPSRDTSREIYDLKNEIYSAIESDINKKIEQGKPDEALEMLKANTFLPSYDELENDIFESVEGSISSLMDDGEYIKAQELLEKNSFITNYDKIAEQIMYETLILQCVFNLRPNMKNPASLQITSVEIYDVGQEYPAFVICESGQNGFGGYSTGYVVFSTEDLDLLGSCTSVYDPDEDDYVEQLIAFLIQEYREEDESIDNALYDLARINTFASSGKMPNIDIEQYKTEVGSNA